MTVEMPDTVRSVGVGVKTLSDAQSAAARRLLGSVRSSAGMGSLPSTVNLLSWVLANCVDASSAAFRSDPPDIPARKYAIVDKALTRC
jgi:hypothetical protein